MERNLHKFWMIEEDVGRGLYMILPGTYESHYEATVAIGREKSNKGMRVALYGPGGWTGGPERLE